MLQNYTTFTHLVNQWVFYWTDSYSMRSFIMRMKEKRKEKKRGVQDKEQ